MKHPGKPGGGPPKQGGGGHAHGGGALHKKKLKPRVGAGLSLDKFARAKASGYDKRAVREAERKEAVIRHSKYQKLQRRLAREGKLLPVPVRGAGGGSHACMRVGTEREGVGGWMKLVGDPQCV